MQQSQSSSKTSIKAVWICYYTVPNFHKFSSNCIKIPRICHQCSCPWCYWQTHYVHWNINATNVHACHVICKDTRLFIVSTGSYIRHQCSCPWYSQGYQDTHSLHWILYAINVHTHGVICRDTRIDSFSPLDFSY